MASTALEEKINKIRQQNEEIRRRYEEVEEDKKNAAKLNALVRMVASTDWPERKEPPEFSNPPKARQKVPKEKHEYTPQNHGGEGKKVHTFAEGDGPPPDPKYNFLADSEREEFSMEHTRESMGNRTHNKVARGNFRKRGIGRDPIQKDNRIHRGNYREEYQPGYEAWRAERNRIDEDRISRQRTAEGNWRREWDNDKMHVVDDVTKTANRPTLGDFAKKDHKDFDRRYHANGGDYSSHNRGGGHRPYRGSSKNFYGNYENRSHNAYDQHRHNVPMSGKAPLSPTAIDERTVIATDKSIKVTLNQPSMPKGPVMSVKVNLPSIAGTGRVGPRQRARVTYSHSDVEVAPDVESFSRQKSFEDKSRGAYFNNQTSANIKRSQSQRKKNETGAKSPYLQRKYNDNEFMSSYPQKPYPAAKSPRPIRPARPEHSNTVHPPEKEDNHISDKDSELTALKENDTDAEQPKNNGDECTTVGTEDTSNTEKYETPSQDSKPVSSELDESREQKLELEVKNTTENTVDNEPKENGEEKTPETTEHIAKDDATDDKVTEGDSEVTNETTNTPEEDHPDKCNLSSNGSDPVPAQREDVQIAPDENNSDSVQPEDNPGKNEEASDTPKEVEEPPVTSDCDNLKDAAADERQDIVASDDNSVTPSEVEKCSVIGATDRLVCTEQVATEARKETETTSDSAETKETQSEQVIAADCKESTRDNETEKSVDGTASEAKESPENKVESQSKASVETKEENEAAAERSSQ